jgi:D-alanyl-D-alanine carboxypeptidase-like protein
MGTHTINHPVVCQVRWRAAKEVSGADIELLDNFVEDNVVKVFIPQLEGVQDNRFDPPKPHFDGNLRFFRKAVDQLKAAWNEIEAQGLKKLVLSFAGSFTPRLQRRKQGGPVHTPSNHAFATAFDINNEFNGQGDPPPEVGKKGSVRELVPIFEKHGFKWGGLFPTPDGMHFEVDKLLAPGSVAVPVPVQVAINGVDVTVSALFVEDHILVGVRALVTLLGGTLTKEGGNPFKATVQLKGTDHVLAGQTIGSVGHVRFNELIALYGLAFTFDKGTRRLDITR